MRSNKIMTTRELAEYIKLNEKTVLRMAQSGDIPGVKLGSQWRFHIDRIDAYIQNDIVKSKDTDLDLVIRTGINIIPLSRLINEELINVDFKGTTSKEVIAELANIASSAGLISSEKDLIGALEKREKLLSTAIGDGIAFPHPRHPSSKFFRNPNIIIVRSRKGIEFEAPDERPVHLFFMTCAPNEFVHLRLLAKISKLLQKTEIVKNLLKADTEEEIIRILLEFDKQHMFPLVKS